MLMNKTSLKIKNMDDSFGYYIVEFLGQEKMVVLWSLRYKKL